MKIKRYKYEYYEDAPHSSGMEEDENGNYVEYNDIKHLLPKGEMEEMLKLTERVCSHCGKSDLYDVTLMVTDKNPMAIPSDFELVQVHECNGYAEIAVRDKNNYKVYAGNMILVNNPKAFYP